MQEILVACLLFAMTFSCPEAAGQFLRSENANDKPATTGSDTQHQRQLQDLTGHGGDPDPNRLPLQFCEGDCDSDDDCDFGLICFQREPNEDVPGCEGGLTINARTDFCIRDPFVTDPPTVLQTISTQQTSSPTAVPSNSGEPVISPAPIEFPTTSEPTAQAPKYLEVVGNNGSPSSAFPLQQCQGDCDVDSHCDWGLYCVQRSRSDDPVPGCDVLGSRPSRRDFCAPLPAEQKMTPGAFRMRLYWQEGYIWQDNPREFFWCVTRDYNGNDKGYCWYGDLLATCNSDQLYLTRCTNDKRQAFVFIPVTSDEVMIQVGTGEDLCFERGNTPNGGRRSIFLQPCDGTNPLQVWFAPSGSFRDGDKFELSQKDFDTQCVSTDHHPKEGEVLELHSCEALRAPDSETSYWVKY